MPEEKVTDQDVQHLAEKIIVNAKKLATALREKRRGEKEK